MALSNVEYKNLDIGLANMDANLFVVVLIQGREMDGGFFAHIFGQRHVYRWTVVVAGYLHGVDKKKSKSGRRVKVGEDYISEG